MTVRYIRWNETKSEWKAEVAWCMNEWRELSKWRKIAIDGHDGAKPKDWQKRRLEAGFQSIAISWFGLTRQKVSRH
jgi:hypothetical protein